MVVKNSLLLPAWCWFIASINLRHWRCSWHVHPKRRLTSGWLHILIPENNSSDNMRSVDVSVPTNGTFPFLLQMLLKLAWAINTTDFLSPLYRFSVAWTRKFTKKCPQQFRISHRVCYSPDRTLFSSRHLCKFLMYSRPLAFPSSICSFSECQLVSRPCYPLHGPLCEQIHVSSCLVIRQQLPISIPVSSLRIMAPATFCVTVCLISLRMSWSFVAHLSMLFHTRCFADYLCFSLIRSVFLPETEHWI
jgi:hypothetical protein